MCKKECRKDEAIMRNLLILLKALAEGVGFEPTNACASAVFKTAAFNHSATLPDGEKRYFNETESLKQERHKRK